MDGIPKSGEFYRHFKNKLYQVIAVAAHSETGEEMVVYQALYGSYGIYVRPLSMFTERLDRGKYPEAAQEYRFERVMPGTLEAHLKGESQSAAMAAAPEQEDVQSEGEVQEQNETLHPLLLEFLEEEEADRKIEILQAMKGKVGQRELDSLYLCLDAKPCGGTPQEQLDNLKQYLSMQQKYDAPRLRRG